MRKVILDDNNVDIIIETDEYVEVYTYHNYASDLKEDDYHKRTWVEGIRSWRLNELYGYNKKTGLKYRIFAEPRLHNHDGYYNYNFTADTGLGRFFRTIDIAYNGADDKDGYITRDVCSSEYGYAECREVLSNNITNNKTSLYLSNEKVDYLETNDIIKRFHEHGKKYAVLNYAYEPEICEISSNINCEIDEWLDKEKGIVHINGKRRDDIKVLEKIDKWRI